MVTQDLLPLSQIELHEAQLRWQQENNADMQRKCFIRMSEAIADAVTAMVQRRKFAVNSAYDMSILSDAARRAYWLWFETEPSLVHHRDLFEVPRLRGKTDYGEGVAEFVASEAWCEMQVGTHSLQMLSPHSPDFAQQARQRGMEPLALWERLYGPEASY